MLNVSPGKLNTPVAVLSMGNLSGARFWSSPRSWETEPKRGADSQPSLAAKPNECSMFELHSRPVGKLAVLKVAIHPHGSRFVPEQETPDKIPVLRIAF